MRLYDIAYRSLLQRKGKSMFLIIGLSLGLITIIALMSITQFLEVSIDQSLKDHGARILISPKSEEIQLSFNGITIAGDRVQEYTDIPFAIIEQMQDIISSSSIASTSTLIQKTVDLGIVNNQETIIVFTDIEQEIAANPSWGIRNRDDSNNGTGNVLIGQQFANRNVISTESVSIAYDSNGSTQFDSDEYIIIGEQGTEIDRLVFLDRSLLMELGQPAELPVNIIDLHIKANAMNEVNSLIASIESEIPEVQARVDLGSLEARQQLFEEFKTYTTFTIFTIVIVGLFLITSTMMASVNERTNEFGVVRTAGYRKKHIATIVLIETILLFLVSFVVAIIVGLLITNIALYSIFTADYYLFIPIFTTLLIGIAGGIISIAASIYPAMKAANLDPVEAVKTV